MNNDDNFRELIRLKDAIGEIREELEKAHYILQDVVEDYLDTVCPTEKEQAARFLYEWPRARAKGYILTDILCRVQTVLAEVDENATEQDQQQEQETKPRRPSKPAT